MTAGTARQRSWVYSAYALFGLAVAIAGFTPTFFLPSVKGTYSAPSVVYIHGAFAFSWLLIFVVQTQAIRLSRLRWHRRFGMVGALCACGLVLTGIPVGLWATRRDIAAGLGDVARGQFVNILIELAVFGGLVVAGVMTRRNPEWHKRLMLLATVSVLGPAWFRMRHHFPAVPSPLLTFSLLADAVVLGVIAHEYAAKRAVHIALLTVAPLMIAVHLAELFLNQSTPWLAIANMLLGE